MSSSPTPDYVSCTPMTGNGLIFRVLNIIIAGRSSAILTMWPAHYSLSCFIRLTISRDLCTCVKLHSPTWHRILIAGSWARRLQVLTDRPPTASTVRGRKEQPGLSASFKPRILSGSTGFESLARYVIHTRFCSLLLFVYFPTPLSHVTRVQRHTNSATTRQSLR